MTPLRVEGNRIVDVATARPVLLRGVVRSGFEYSRDPGIGAAEIQHMVLNWGSNIVRLPFNQDWALRRDGYDPEPYLARIDAVIRLAAEAGAYTLLDLQWLDAVTKRGGDNFVPPLPNAESIEVWRQLARRYATQDSVLYDVFNEPHDALPDDPVPLLGASSDGSTFSLHSNRVSAREWHPWATLLVEAIRGERPDALIFISGVNWAYDLTSFPLPGIEGVVYSTHVYKNKGNNPDKAFGNLSRRYPVFAGEWGAFPGEEDWGRDILQYLTDHDIGWTAWSWTDKPHLIQQPVTDDYVPTPFGELVRNALLTAKPFLPTAIPDPPLST